MSILTNSNNRVLNNDLISIQIEYLYNDLITNAPIIYGCPTLYIMTWNEFSCHFITNNIFYNTHPSYTTHNDIISQAISKLLERLNKYKMGLKIQTITSRTITNNITEYKFILSS